MPVMMSGCYNEAQSIFFSLKMKQQIFDVERNNSFLAVLFQENI